MTASDFVELYVLRHGEAGKRLQAGGKDSERALTISGRAEVEAVAKALAKLNVNFDIIATSPLKRALQTAEILAKSSKAKKGTVEEWEELKPEGDRQELCHRLSRLKQENTVLIVGHEPHLSSMIGEIVFGESANIVLKKAGLAKIAISSFQPKLRGELKWLLTPKHLKKIAK
jgi:phosphohistidine phosphatase